MEFDWTTKIDTKIRHRTITGKFLLSVEDIENAIEAQWIFVDGVYYEVPVNDLKMNLGLMKTSCVQKAVCLLTLKEITKK